MTQPPNETPPAVTEPSASIELPPLPEAGDGSGGDVSPGNNAPKVGEVERQTRADRKREYMSLKDGMIKKDQELQELREKIARLEGVVSARPQETKPETDEATKRIDELTAQADRDLEMASTKGDQKAMDRYYASQREIGRLIARQEFAELVKTLPKPEHGPSAIQALVESEYPWLATNERARRWAANAEDQLILEGRPPTLATTKEALALAAVKFHLGGARPQTADLRRYGGVQSDDSEDTGTVTVKFDSASLPLIRAYAQRHNITDQEAMKKLGQGIKKAQSA